MAFRSTSCSGCASCASASLRIRALLDCLLAEQTERATAALLADLVQVGQDNRSLRALIASSSHADRRQGGRAQRRNRRALHHPRRAPNTAQMLGKAAGGGALIGLTTWVKFALYGLGLSAFWDGFSAGLNYAVCFVLIQLLHLTVATKQPAMTAPAMVAKLQGHPAARRGAQLCRRGDPPGALAGGGHPRQRGRWWFRWCC